MDILEVAANELLAQPRVTAHVLVAMPSVDLGQARRAAELMARRASGVPGVILIVNDTEREGYVRVCNRAFQQSEGAFFAYVAQDAFAGRGWLRTAVKAMERGDKGLLAFNDGKWHGTLAGFGLVSRAWARTVYGDVLFHPGYKRHFADAELTLIARAQEQLCYSARSVLIEVDWNKDRRPTHQGDRALFLERAASRFEGKVAKPEDCQLMPGMFEMKQSTSEIPLPVFH